MWRVLNVTCHRTRSALRLGHSPRSGRRADLWPGVHGRAGRGWCWRRVSGSAVYRSPVSPRPRGQGTRATPTSLVPLPQARCHGRPQTQVWPCLPISGSRTGPGTRPPPGPGPTSAARCGLRGRGHDKGPPHARAQAPSPRPWSLRPPGATRAGRRGRGRHRSRSRPQPYANLTFVAFQHDKAEDRVSTGKYLPKDFFFIIYRF